MTSLKRREIPAAFGLTIGALGIFTMRDAARASPTNILNPNDGLSFNAEAIHQEIRFSVPPSTIYETLLDSAAFDAVTKLGEAAKSGAKLGDAPTAITRTPGAAFKIFGGYISGRQIELVPDRRIVQVWRERGWPNGAYSIVRFELHAEANGSQVSFDHTGFPKRAGPHLASGWYGNYWNPMKAYFERHPHM